MEIKNILIVDDEPVNLKILRAMLVPEGYNVVEADNGAKALELIDLALPDIILLDVMMPEIDGFEVCRRIKSQKERRMIPILMVTALQDKIHRQQAMEAGADDFLSKPIDRIELLIRVKSLLRIKKYSDELIESYQMLKEKNRQLEELEKAKEGLTHMIIHDLRGPLTNISMNIDMCLMKIDPTSPISSYLNNASQQCLYMNEMIQGLLDIHRMEEGKIDLVREYINLKDLIAEVAENYSSQLETKKITMNLEFHSSVSRLLVDPRLIKRIIFNLLDNAVRHTPQGGQILIRTEDSLDGKCITISVIDSGPGLDEKFHDRIFNKFEQVKLKKEGVTTGSIGLGLAFCKMATEQHGGKIWVSHGPNGKGCSFSFMLPVEPEGNCRS